MAEIKKYLDTVALGTLVDQIKAEDAKVLAAAKKYTDDAGKLYDTAGAAATAEKNAKDYTDLLANGAVATNTAAIAKLNGEGEGSVKKAVADAAATLQAGIDAVDAKADHNAADIEVLEGQVDALIKGTYDDTEVRGLITANAEAIEAMEKAHGEDVEAIEGAIALKADQTALDDVSAVANAAVKQSDYDTKVAALESEDARIAGLVAAEAERAAGVESGLETRLKAVEDDHLVAADKTELQNNIDIVAGALERLTNGVSAEEIDGVNDLIQYVKDHGTEVTGMQKDISDNTAAIAAEAERAKGEEAKNAAAAAGALAAAEAAQAAADAEAERAAGVEGGLDTRLKAVEAQLGEGDGSVADMIADAKQEAVDAAAADATTKANAAETAAKEHATGLNTAMNARVEALEAIDHDHANKAELDLIATGDKAKWDASAAKAHEHANKDVLDGVTAEKVAAWDAAEGNAKTYADGLNTAMTTKVDGIDNRVKALEEAAPDYALDADLDKAVERLTTAEANIAANTSAINSFTAITSEEIVAMFS